MLRAQLTPRSIWLRLAHATLAQATVAGLIAALGAGVPARAQEEASEQEQSADPPPSALPAPTLEEEDPLEPQPEAPPEEPTRILYRIGPGMHPEWEEDDAQAPPDVAFQIPGDLRTTGAPMQLPQSESTPDARTFGVSVGAGFARLLGAESVDFFRIEQRFHARIPGADFLYVGAAASQMFGDNAVLAGGGPRVGLGATFCGASWIRCEGVAVIQPGIMGGDLIGTRFDLHAALEARFLFPPMLELGVSGGYSLLGEASMFHVTGTGGFAF